jgi:hypothetical protein
MTQQRALADVFKLEYPQSVGVFQTYEAAQKVVDYLSDKEFPVQNLCIVGTDLKSVERVTGRQTWRTVFSRGLQSGLSTGLMVALIMLLFNPDTNFWALLLGALGIGMVIGMVMSAIAYLTSRGKRDFTSVTQTIATHYELLSEHKVVQQARELLAGMPEARAAIFNPAQQWGYQYQAAGYPQQSYPQQGVPQQNYPNGYQTPGYPVPNPAFPPAQVAYPVPTQPDPAQPAQAPSFQAPPEQTEQPEDQAPSETK